MKEKGRRQGRMKLQLIKKNEKCIVVYCIVDLHTFILPEMML